MQESFKVIQGHILSVVRESTRARSSPSSPQVGDTLACLACGLDDALETRLNLKQDKKVSIAEGMVVKRRQISPDDPDRHDPVDGIVSPGAVPTRSSRTRDC